MFAVSYDTPTHQEEEISKDSKPVEFPAFPSWGKLDHPHTKHAKVAARKMRAIQPKIVHPAYFPSHLLS